MFPFVQASHLLQVLRHILQVGFGDRVLEEEVPVAAQDDGHSDQVSDQPPSQQQVRERVSQSDLGQHVRESEVRLR